VEDDFKLFINNLGLENQRILNSWLNGDVTNFALPAGMPLRAVLRIASGLATTAGKAGTEWEYNRRFWAKAGETIKTPRESMYSSKASYLFYSSAINALQNWPDSFTEFVYSFWQYRLSHLKSNHYSSQLGHLYKLATEYWDHPVYEPVIQQLQNDMANQRSGDAWYPILGSTQFRNENNLITLEQVAELFETSTTTILFWIKEGYIDYEN
jgi:hypothetical protein